MFSPTKTWRRWHRKVNVNQKRYAVVSALAASAVPALVQARGHRIDKVSEVPLVISNDAVKGLQKTAAAVKLLKTLNAFDDVERVKFSRKLRAGKGKARNRRFVQRRGPLIIYDQKTELVRAFRNIPGVELASVNRLNLLQLAPGGHLGRFVIWIQDAFQKLDEVWGTVRRASKSKRGYTLPRNIVGNSDLSRLINSDEVQSAVRPRAKNARKVPRKKNALRNLGVLVKLNPYAKALRRKELRLQEAHKAKSPKILAAKKKKAAHEKKKKQVLKKQRKAFYSTLLS